jgi:hypothetical protein
MKAAAAAASAATAAPPRSAAQPGPQQPRFSLADCTADLLALVVGCLGPRDRAAFASACSFHLLVLRMAEERPQLRQQQPGDYRAAVDAAVTAAAARAAAGLTRQPPCKPPPFGLGYVDRPRFLQPGERPETVVRKYTHSTKSPPSTSLQLPSHQPPLFHPQQPTNRLW